MRTIYIFNLQSNQLTNEYYYILNNNRPILEKYNLYFLPTQKENTSIKKNGNSLLSDILSFNKKNTAALNKYTNTLRHIIDTTESDIIICFPFSMKNILTTLVKHILNPVFKETNTYKIKILYSFCPVEELFESNARILYDNEEKILLAAKNFIFCQKSLPDIEIFKEAMAISQEAPVPVLISQKSRPTPHQLFKLFDRDIPKAVLPDSLNILTTNRHITAFMYSLPNIYPLKQKENYLEIISTLNSIHNEAYIDSTTWTNPSILRQIRTAAEEVNKDLSKLIFNRKQIFEDYLSLPSKWTPYTSLPPHIHTFFLEKTLKATNIDHNYISEQLSRNFILKKFSKKEQTLIINSTYKKHPDNPVVSILTLTRNHENFIGDNIESILEQKTKFPIQHIIVLDGSEDNTHIVVEKYANKYKHIIPILFTEKTQSGDNVRALFEQCRTPYAALCDGDDYFTDPYKLQQQVDFMERHKNCAICFHPVDIVYEDGTPSKTYPPDTLLPGGKHLWYSLQDLLISNFIQTNSVLYRWRFPTGLPEWFDPTLVPGDWYWHLLHAETGEIAYLDKPMSVYRRHAKSLYALAEKDHIAHRHKHGLNELKTYTVCNRHFKGRYYTSFSRLARGVFADFVHYYIKTKDDKMLQEAIALAPDFAKDFLNKLHASNMDIPVK